MQPQTQKACATPQKNPLKILQPSTNEERERRVKGFLSEINEDNFLSIISTLIPKFIKLQKKQDSGLPLCTEDKEHLVDLKEILALSFETFRRILEAEIIRLQVEINQIRDSCSIPGSKGQNICSAAIRRSLKQFEQDLSKRQWQKNVMQNV